MHNIVKCSKWIEVGTDGDYFSFKIFPIARNEHFSSILSLVSFYTEMCIKLFIADILLTTYLETYFKRSSNFPPHYAIDMAHMVLVSIYGLMSDSGENGEDVRDRRSR